MKLYWYFYRKYNSILDWFAFKFQNPYEINAGGNCPVQAEGYLYTGEFYYFRARGSHWRLEIAKGEDAWQDEKIEFSYGEKYCDDQFGAGWMTRREAIKFANKAIKFYYQKREPIRQVSANPFESQNVSKKYKNRWVVIIDADTQEGAAAAAQQLQGTWEHGAEPISARADQPSDPIHYTYSVYKNYPLRQLGVLDS